MPFPDSLGVTRVRLVDTGSFPTAGSAARAGARRGPIYRPIVIGPAILWRCPGRAGSPTPWEVDLRDHHGLEPATPRRAVDVERILAWRRAERQQCRVALALACGHDLVVGAAAAWFVAGRPRHAGGRFRRGAAIEIYGWSLLYPRPGDAGRAIVDPHDTHPDLPAWYESPLELADRSAFLASRGIRTRALALVTRPEDFVSGVDGPVNRFFPHGAYRTPADLRRFV